MKLYFACVHQPLVHLVLACNAKNILISYAFKEVFEMPKLFKNNECSLLCDSGAFSAWNNGTIIDRDAYIAFIKQRNNIITQCVNLDVIPGRTGEKPTRQQIDNACRQGWDNLLYFREQGLDPIHVFHQGEDIAWLDKMLDVCTYIGISPSNDSHDNEKEQWLDYAFRHILLSKNPTIKTHGFGVTSRRLLERYPWYSADSSSFIFNAMMGNIMAPHGNFTISEKALNDPAHINNQPSLVREQLVEHLKQFGFTLKQCMKKWQYRAIVNTCWYLDLENQINNKPCANIFLNQGVLL